MIATPGSDWEQEIHRLMEQARNRLRPEWKHGETVVLKTVKGNLYTLEIPDFQDPDIREPLENACVQALADHDDTEVLLCLATVSGNRPEIPSWNLRSRLLEIHPNNLQTLAVGWGGEDIYILRPFQSLLPPERE